MHLCACVNIVVCRFNGCDSVIEEYGDGWQFNGFHCIFSYPPKHRVTNPFNMETITVAIPQSQSETTIEKAQPPETPKKAIYDVTSQNGSKIRFI